MVGVMEGWLGGCRGEQEGHDLTGAYSRHLYQDGPRNIRKHKSEMQSVQSSKPVLSARTQLSTHSEIKPVCTSARGY